VDATVLSPDSGLVKSGKLAAGLETKRPPTNASTAGDGGDLVAEHEKVVRFPSGDQFVRTELRAVDTNEVLKVRYRSLS